MNRLKYLAAFACAIALCLGLAGCGDDPAQDQAESAPSQEAASQSAEEASQGADQATTDIDISAADLANVDIVVEYGDYDTMADLSANIQSAKAGGSVVQVDGLVKNYGSAYSIVEENADGTQRIGTVFVIEGAGPEAYPQDGQRARITGIVDSDETGYSYFIKTLPEFVDVA